MIAFIDCQICKGKETKPASEIYFKKNPDEILVRCDECNTLQYWKGL